MQRKKTRLTNYQELSEKLTTGDLSTERTEASAQKGEADLYITSSEQVRRVHQKARAKQEAEKESLVELLPREAQKEILVHNHWEVISQQILLSEARA